MGAIRTALEKAGVIFVEENGDGPGEAEENEAEVKPEVVLSSASCPILVFRLRSRGCQGATVASGLDAMGPLV
jgi:uncharacterized protein (DUF169 family)